MKYPRRFTFRHVPAIPPDVRPRQYRFELEGNDFRFLGEPAEWQRMCSLAFGHTLPSSRWNQLHRLDKSIAEPINFKCRMVAEDFGGERIIITFTKRPPVCAKLAATFRKLQN